MTTDKPYRSLVKAISWRLTGTVDTMVVSYFVTGQVKTALAIGGAELFTKICLYYAHERVWEKISFGRVKVDSHYDI
ncbi:MAG: DUF2061 domain-containing protein [Pedosphaera sp.]|nr:DUF2061 domain-containing protein [Pedosphaera sp.]